MTNLMFKDSSEGGSTWLNHPRISQTLQVDGDLTSFSPSLMLQDKWNVMQILCRFLNRKTRDLYLAVDFCPIFVG